MVFAITSLVLGFGAWLGYDLLVDAFEAKERSLNESLFRLDLFGPFPLGSMPLELDPAWAKDPGHNPFQSEENQMSFSPPARGSIRVTAMLRRLAKEREILANLPKPTKGQDGLWRLNGKFVSQAFMAQTEAQQIESVEVVNSINDRLRAMGVK